MPRRRLENAQHRGDLRRNVTKFLPPDVVYILESMTDIDQDLDESFWQAASSEQARKSEARLWSQLASLDATVDNASRGHAERLRSLAARTALLWEGILWPRGQILQDFLLNKLRVLIVTSDKLRKTLGTSSSWFHQRPLGILIQDEYENEGFLDFASLIIHFNTVITGGDPRQVLKRNFLPSTRLPLPEQQETQGISLEDEPVADWLEARSCVVRMETSYRLGPEVRELVDEFFPPPWSRSFSCAGKTSVCVWRRWKIIGFIGKLARSRCRAQSLATLHGPFSLALLCMPCVRLRPSR